MLKFRFDALQVRHELEWRLQCVKECQTPVFFLNFFLPSHYHLLSSISCLVGVFNIRFFSSDRTSSPLCYNAVFKPWGAYVWFLEWWYVLAVSSVVCPTRTAFPHPLFLSYVFSWSFLCVLVFLLLISMCYSFLLFICTCLAWNDLQATLLFPYLAFSLVELMGNAVFPPFLLPLPPSSPASFACTAQWKALNKKDFGWKRSRTNSRYFPVYVFYSLPVPASRHLAFEAAYSWELVERLILGRVAVDWHLISLFECDCYPYAGDHTWLTTPALCASSVFLPDLQLTFCWLSLQWKEVEIVFLLTESLS